MDEARIRLVEAGLEELVGGTSPPDLSEKILRTAAVPDRRPTKGRWIMAASIVMAFGILWAILSFQPPPGPAVTGMSVAEDIPEAKTVTLRPESRTLRQILADLSSQTGYGFESGFVSELLDTEVPGVPREPRTFLELVDALRGGIPKGRFEAGPSSPVRFSRSGNEGSIAVQTRGAFAAELWPLGKALQLTVHGEPSLTSVAKVEVRILELLDRGGREIDHPRSPIDYSGLGHAGVEASPLLPRDGVLSRVRIALDVHYVTRKRVFRFKIRKEEQTSEEAGLRFTTSIRSNRAATGNDEVLAQVESAAGSEDSDRALVRLRTYGQIGDRPLLRIEKATPDEQTRMGRSRIVLGQKVWVGCELWPRYRADELDVSLHLPEAVEIRTVEFDLRDVRLK
jgi:hypothetical protein